MPTTEPIQGGPYPVPSDPPDGPNQLAALAVWAAGRLNMRFPSPAARDVAITSPVEGMECVTGTGMEIAKWIYVNGGWNLMLIPSPWTNLSLAAGWSAWGLAPAVRRSANRWHYRGSFTGAVTTSVATFANAGSTSMPPGYGTDELSMVAGSQGPICVVSIGADGSLRVRGTSAASTVITLDGLSHAAV